MNYNDEKMERKFSIYHLFWNILEKWRQILVSMLFFAFVFVAYGVISNQSVTKENQQILQEQNNEQKEGNIELSVMDKELVEVYWNLYRQYEQQKDYNENAVLMKLDGENLHRTQVQFYVDRKVINEQKGRTETDENFVKVVKDVLRNVLTSTELVTAVEEIIGTEDMKYLGECVSPATTCNKVTEESVNVFAFAVVAPTKEQSEAIAKKAIEIMEKAAGSLKGQFGEFELSLMSSEYTVWEEQAMLTYQRDKQNALWSSKNTLTSISDKFTQQQADYLYELSDQRLKLKSKLAETETDAVEAGPVVKKTLSPVLYGIAGLFAGILFVGFMTSISYLNDKKMRFYSLGCENFGMRVIQTIIDEDNFNKNIIDKILFGLRYRNLHLFSKEEALAFAIADLKTTMKKKRMNKLYISLYDFKKQKELAEKIQKSLNNNGIQADYGNSILYDAQAMEKLGDNDAVVFLEECNKTLLAEVEKEKRLCEEKEIHMLGMIVSVSGNK